MKYENGKQTHGHSRFVTDSSLIHEPALDPSPHWQCVESCAPVEVYLHPDSGISEENNYRKRSVHHRNIKKLSRKPRSNRNCYFLNMLTSRQQIEEIKVLISIFSLKTDPV